MDQSCAEGMDKWFRFVSFHSISDRYSRKGLGQNTRLCALKYASIQDGEGIMRKLTLVQNQGPDMGNR